MRNYFLFSVQAFGWLKFLKAVSVKIGESKKGGEQEDDKKTL